MRIATTNMSPLWGNEGLMVVARTRWPHIGKPRTDVLGYSQPSLAGLWLLAGRDPGLTSWATFSRPYGTQVREASSHADSEGALGGRSFRVVKDHLVKRTH
jgi:hypothetical protein